MCPQSALPKRWLFTDVFRKPSLLSTTLALANVSFLSWSLNLNCKRGMLSRGTRTQAHILGRISQVSTLHPQPLLLDGRDLIFPTVPTWSSSPRCVLSCLVMSDSLQPYEL